MTPTKRLLVVLLLLGIATDSGLSAQGAVNLVDLIGKSRSELAAEFPSFQVKDWRGWDSAWPLWGRHGQLVALRLQPRAPISEQEAEDAVRQLGVTVERARYFAGPNEHGYSDMAGPVRTVIYDRRPDGEVWSIRIHSKLADTEA